MSDQQLDMIHDSLTVKYAATIEAVRGHLKSLARVRSDGIVDSDDAAEYLERYAPLAEKRLIGAVFKAPHFVQVGYTKSRRRRGMHALWRVA